MHLSCVQPKNYTDQLVLCGDQQLVRMCWCSTLYLHHLAAAKAMPAGQNGYAHLWLPRQMAESWLEGRVVADKVLPNVVLSLEGGEVGYGRGWGHRELRLSGVAQIQTCIACSCYHSHQPESDCPAANSACPCLLHGVNARTVMHASPAQLAINGSQLQAASVTCSIADRHCSYRW